jgi:ribosomal protein S18 acetylase RimI-like enzyme
MLKIFPVKTDKDLEIVKELFIEYADFLKELLGKHDRSWADYQNQKAFKEANNLPGEYAMPKGCILLAKYQNEIAGCIAISEITIGLCELKRIYVKPQYRRMGIGKKLADTVIKKAAQLNYERMRLDTNDLFLGAKELYTSLGFKEIGHIVASPLKSSVHMELKLR